MAIPRLYPSAFLSSAAGRLLSLHCPHPLRVGIDGVDTSGKTTLADELACQLAGTHRPVIRASIDRFHNPRSVRYHLGADSPEGFYRDSYDLPALRRVLLDPLGPGGDRWIETARFDVLSDRPVQEAPIQAPPDAILLFDGIFLHRPELVDAWDFTFFLKVSFETVLDRAVRRDGPLLGSPETVLQRYQTRYIPAQQRYLASCQPETRANWTVDIDRLLLPG